MNTDNFKFVIMQEPSRQSKIKQEIGFGTIGLRSLYPNNGYNSCDEYGLLKSGFPRNDDKSFEIRLAFLDEQSQVEFKGTKIFNESEDCYFAIVKWVAK